MSEEELKIIKKHLSYERLLQIARKLHLWVFLHSDYEEEEYKEMGLTTDENAILGSIYVIDKENNDIITSFEGDVMKGAKANERN